MLQGAANEWEENLISPHMHLSKLSCAVRVCPGCSNLLCLVFDSVVGNRTNTCIPTLVNGDSLMHARCRVRSLPLRLLAQWMGWSHCKSPASPLQVPACTLIRTSPGPISSWGSLNPEELSIQCSRSISSRYYPSKPRLHGPSVSTV